MPIEIGIHALATVTDKTKKGGGIRAYADEVGKGETSVTRWVNAGNVYCSLSATLQTKDTQDKLQHPYEISKAPQSSWQDLVD